MFSTSFLYFSVAIFGENIESSEAHGLQLVEGQEEEAAESGHNEEQEAAEIHNESGESPEQRLEEQEAVEQNTSEAEHIEGGEETEETIHQETSENQKRSLEFPLSVSAGIGYTAIGLLMILDKRNSKIPYIIAIVGSLILLVIYFASRTVGISILGTEPIGLLDAIAAGLQVVIIATSLYILIGKIYSKGMAVGE
jgi:multidrug efflux pump subunit AcrB